MKNTKKKESNKKIVALSALGILIVVIGAFALIGSIDKPVTETDAVATTESKVEVKKATNIKSTVEAWKAQGLEVSDKKPAFYNMIGAKDGAKYDVNETNVELYEFADEAKAKEAKDKFFSSINAEDVIIKSNFMVLVHSDTGTEAKKIKSVF